MLPQAIVVRTCAAEPELYDVDTFIELRRTMLTDGTLTRFAEHATGGSMEVFGDVTHRFGSYAKDGEHDGTPRPGRGMKLIQFIRTSKGWRVSATA